MSTDWIPEGSVPYDTAFCDGEYSVQTELDSGAYFSTIPYKPVGEKSLRDPRSCIGNNHTCKGYKSAGTDYCSGHRKAIAKAEAA